MSDVEFKFYGVPNRYQDVVQRMAVLYTLRQPAQTMDDVRDMTNKLLNQWRARIGALTSSGWVPSRGERASHSILYARNCKPTFAITGHQTRPCHNTVICPWCYARWVRELWQTVDADMPAPDPAQPTELEAELGREMRSIVLDTNVEEQPRQYRNAFRFHLVERHHYFYRPLLPEEDPQNWTVPRNLAGILNNLEKNRALVIKMVDPVGAFLYTTIEPWDNGRQWKLHHRQLFKLSPEQEIPRELVEATDGQLIRHMRPTRKEVLQIVSRICRYPVGLMTGDQDLTATLLDVRRSINFRGHARYRSFRQRRTT